MLQEQAKRVLIHKELRWWNVIPLEIFILNRVNPKALIVPKHQGGSDSNMILLVEVRITTLSL